MKVLVTGANGFVGNFVSRDLESAGHTVIAHRQSDADLRDADALTDFVRSTKPDACIHLAGMAFVPKAWEDPALAFAVNVEGTIHLLEAFRAHAPTARFLYVSSALVYGNRPRPAPIRETDPAEPDHLYGVTKLTADLTVLLYARRYGMHALSARPCNHIGPGQSADFVVPSFARQVAAIRDGRQPPVMRVGNLDSEREFADVRDVARAYRLLVEKGSPGRTYNVATGRRVRIGWLLETLFAHAGIRPRVETDPALYRPTDAQPLLDTSAIRADTGWEPVIRIEDTLRDVLTQIVA